MVEIDGTLRMMAHFSFTIFNVEDVVALDVIEGQIEHTNHEFQIMPGQIAATDDCIQTGESIADVGTVDGRHLHVAKAKQLPLAHVL